MVKFGGWQGCVDNIFFFAFSQQKCNYNPQVSNQHVLILFPFLSLSSFWNKIYHLLGGGKRIAVFFIFFVMLLRQVKRHDSSLDGIVEFTLSLWRRSSEGTRKSENSKLYAFLVSAVRSKRQQEYLYYYYYY